MWRVLLLCVCAVSLQAFNPNEYQRRFWKEPNYLDKYHRPLNTLSEEILFYTMTRTGTILTMSIMNQLTEKVCIWHTPSPRPWGQAVPINRAMVQVDETQYPILGSHVIQPFVRIGRNNKLVMTIRDPKEKLSRLGKLDTSPASIKQYYKFLEFFDSWDQDKRFLVKYEDLIERPIDLIHRLGEFLNAKPEREQELIDQFDVFKEKVHASYRIHPGRTKNKGTDIRVHQKNIPEQQLMQLDVLMKKANPYLYNKYLKQYELKQNSVEQET